MKQPQNQEASAVAEARSQSDERRVITEAEWEHYADALVMDALRRDRRYLHAENAEDQALAEEQIGDEVQAAMEAKYRIAE